MHHEYSDKLLETATSGIPCYSIKETLSEKLRALIQRSYTAPRDFYDIWYLSRNVPYLDWKEIRRAFHQKMKYKNIEFTGIDQMINEENDKRLTSAWKNSLAHQIPGNHFPEYTTVRNEIKQLLVKYFNGIY